MEFLSEIVTGTAKYFRIELSLRFSHPFSTSRTNPFLTGFAPRIGTRVIPVMGSPKETDPAFHDNALCNMLEYQERVYRTPELTLRYTHVATAHFLDWDSRKVQRSN